MCRPPLRVLDRTTALVPEDSPGSCLTRRIVLVRSQLAVAVLVQCFESRRSIGQLCGVNNAVLIGIQRHNDCGNGRLCGRNVRRRSMKGICPGIQGRLRRSPSVGPWRKRLAPTMRDLRLNLVPLELAVAVFIQRLERRGRVREFGGVDDAIFVGVQRCRYERLVHRRMLAMLRWPGGVLGHCAPRQRA